METTQGDAAPVLIGTDPLLAKEYMQTLQQIDLLLLLNNKPELDYGQGLFERVRRRSASQGGATGTAAPSVHAETASWSDGPTVVYTPHATAAAPPPTTSSAHGTAHAASPAERPAPHSSEPVGPAPVTPPPEPAEPPLQMQSIASKLPLPAFPPKPARGPSPLATSIATSSESSSSTSPSSTSSSTATAPSSPDAAAAPAPSASPKTEGKAGQPSATQRPHDADSPAQSPVMSPHRPRSVPHRDHHSSDEEDMVSAAQRLRSSGSLRTSRAAPVPEPGSKAGQDDSSSDSSTIGQDDIVARAHRARASPIQSRKASCRQAPDGHSPQLGAARQGSRRVIRSDSEEESEEDMVEAVRKLRNTPPTQPGRSTVAAPAPAARASQATDAASDISSDGEGEGLMERIERMRNPGAPRPVRAAAAVRPAAPHAASSDGSNGGSVGEQVPSTASAHSSEEYSQAGLGGHRDVTGGSWQEDSAASSLTGIDADAPGPESGVLWAGRSSSGRSRRRAYAVYRVADMLPTENHGARLSQPPPQGIAAGRGSSDKLEAGSAHSGMTGSNADPWPEQTLSSEAGGVPSDVHGWGYGSETGASRLPSSTRGDTAGKVGRLLRDGATWDAERKQGRTWGSGQTAVPPLDVRGLRTNSERRSEQHPPPSGRQPGGTGAAAAVPGDASWREVGGEGRPGGKPPMSPVRARGRGEGAREGAQLHTSSGRSPLSQPHARTRPHERPTQSGLRADEDSSDADPFLWMRKAQRLQRPITTLVSSSETSDGDDAGGGVGRGRPAGKRPTRGATAPRQAPKQHARDDAHKKEAGSPARGVRSSPTAGVEPRCSPGPKPAGARAAAASTDVQGPQGGRDQGTQLISDAAAPAVVLMPVVAVLPQAPVVPLPPAEVAAQDSMVQPTPDAAPLIPVATATVPAVVPAPAPVLPVPAPIQQSEPLPAPQQGAAQPQPGVVPAPPQHPVQAPAPDAHQLLMEQLLLQSRNLGALTDLVAQLVQVQQQQHHSTAAATGPPPAPSTTAAARTSEPTAEALHIIGPTAPVAAVHTTASSELQGRPPQPPSSGPSPPVSAASAPPAVQPLLVAGFVRQGVDAHSPRGVQDAQQAPAAASMPTEAPSAAPSARQPAAAPTPAPVPQPSTAPVTLHSAFVQQFLGASREAPRTLERPVVDVPIAIAAAGQPQPVSWSSKSGHPVTVPLVPWYDITAPASPQHTAPAPQQAPTYSPRAPEPPHAPNTAAPATSNALQHGAAGGEIGAGGRAPVLRLPNAPGAQWAVRVSGDTLHIMQHPLPGMGTPHVAPQGALQGWQGTKVGPLPTLPAGQQGQGVAAGGVAAGPTWGQEGVQGPTGLAPESPMYGHPGSLAGSGTFLTSMHTQPVSTGGSGGGSGTGAGARQQATADAVGAQPHAFASITAPGGWADIRGAGPHAAAAARGLLGPGVGGWGMQSTGALYTGMVAPGYAVSQFPDYMTMANAHGVYPGAHFTPSMTLPAQLHAGAALMVPQAGAWPMYFTAGGGLVPAGTGLGGTAGWYGNGARLGHAMQPGTPGGMAMPSAAVEELDLSHGRGMVSRGAPGGM